MQGYESARFRSFFGKKSLVPGNEDRTDYLMLRRKRMAYYVEDDNNNDEEEKTTEAKTETFDDLFS